MKQDFPILEQTVNGHPLTYLDSSNTSLTPIQVTKAMDEYYHEYNANVHRALYHLSEKATQAVEDAREKVQAFINADSKQEIIFTKNGTESLNLIVQTWGRENLKKGDVVVLSVMEHHSNIVPWQILQKENDFEIRYLSLTSEGRLDVEEYKSILKNEKVRIVSLVHESNVLGTINPVKDLILLAHEQGALFMLDACQSVAHMPLDVQDLDADFVVMTGHKMLGPTGIGVLYGKKTLLENMPPWIGGGDMIRSVTLEGSSWNDLPYKFEAGTPNISGIIGLGAAIDYLQKIGMDKIYQHEEELGQYTLQALTKIPNLRLLGPQDMKDRGSIFSFDLPGLHPHDLAAILAERGICIRAGNHCAQPLMEYLHVPATSRVSLFWYTTQSDIDRLIEGIQHAQSLFSR